MTKKELLHRLVERDFYSSMGLEWSKRKVYSMINFLLGQMKEAILHEGELKVSGFGRFKLKKASHGHRISFKPSKKLLCRLNSGLKRTKM
jgi:nucleoid DNA-binding protein